MARSTLTLAELEAQAILLGMDYDPRDHTFYHAFEDDLVDADTLEQLEWDAEVVDKRMVRVRDKEIGPADC